MGNGQDVLLLNDIDSSRGSFLNRVVLCSNNVVKCICEWIYAKCVLMIFCLSFIGLDLLCYTCFCALSFCFYILSSLLPHVLLNGNNSAAACPILLKFGGLMHYGTHG